MTDPKTYALQVLQHVCDYLEVHPQVLDPQCDTIALDAGPLEDLVLNRDASHVRRLLARADFKAGLDILLLAHCRLQVGKRKLRQLMQEIENILTQTYRPSQTALSIAVISYHCRDAIAARNILKEPLLPAGQRSLDMPPGAAVMAPRRFAGRELPLYSVGT